MLSMLLLPDYRVRQRDYLLEISRALTSQLNLDEVLKLILEASVSMLAGSVGLIALRDDDHVFRPQASFGVELDMLPLFDPLLEHIAQKSDEPLDSDELNRKMRLVART